MRGSERLAGVTLEALEVGVDQRVDRGFGGLMLELVGGPCGRRGGAADQPLLAVQAQQRAGGVAV